MPERPLLVAAYAAGAGLAAATLVYVFGPTYLLDNEAANNARGTKKRVVVGLSNPANDCFINSVLQALAGSPKLRLCLIKEVYLRQLSSIDSISGAQDPQAANVGDQKSRAVASLRAGLITNALKSMLDALNERPLSKKTITAQPLISAVERAFNTRVSRYQQDAQEFLQILLERLADEHKELNRAWNASGEAPSTDASSVATKVIEKLLDEVKLKEDVSDQLTPSTTETGEGGAGDKHETDNEKLSATIKDQLVAQPLPFQGKIESQIECTVCRFKPAASVSDFVTLTLNVPNASGSTTLDACFDGVLKVEHIDGFRCDRCRLVHALQVSKTRLSRSGIDSDEKNAVEQHCTRLQQAIDKDPENPPKDLVLPPITSAPTSRISKHMKISLYPTVLALHLSRSMWDAHSSSSKNMTKVSFTETLPLGSLLERKTYQLYAMVTHKGGHNSGHYETFRRQWAQAPFSTPANMGTHGIYSQTTTPMPSPRIDAAIPHDAAKDVPDIVTVANDLDLSIVQSSTTRASDPAINQSSDHGGLHTGAKASEKRSNLLGHTGKSKRRVQERWWRISDDKVRECKASDVLSMQREVYLLFYELQ